MNIIESQNRILDELCRIMHMSAETGYEKLSCRFYFSSSSDGSISIGSKFSYTRHGEEKSAALAYPESKKIGALVSTLHEEMKKHTSGDWYAFILTIGEDGKAKVDFEYKKK
ncbi:immunity protein YezG family protein [Aliidiomarina soli]|uniref:DUF600 domain-containing protein n=1 Tax=Aliidiomarina soli TaxID=1928574 RepID=A0A432WE31_9GAMM|nr:immunity protein YezG family protein [Aliidiomarina soli]RUO31141.1 hypothetical protein CWE14_11640 [Aliidiomarina soli]